MRSKEALFGGFRCSLKAVGVHLHFEGIYSSGARTIGISMGAEAIGNSHAVGGIEGAKHITVGDDQMIKTSPTSETASKINNLFKKGLIFFVMVALVEIPVDFVTR